jgi:dymeclin
MTRMHDKYLHTNCLAALANMSSQFIHLHAYVTQRFVSLFSLLSRKHSKIFEQCQQERFQTEHTSMTNISSKNDEQIHSYADDLTLIEDVMRMILEILNSCLIHTLQQNPNLVYALLYNRDIFDQYRTHPNFQELLINIDTVV